MKTFPFRIELLSNNDIKVLLPNHIINSLVEQYKINSLIMLDKTSTKELKRELLEEIALIIKQKSEDLK